MVAVLALHLMLTVSFSLYYAIAGRPLSLGLRVLYIPTDRGLLAAVHTGWAGCDWLLFYGGSRASYSDWRQGQKWVSTSLMIRLIITYIIMIIIITVMVNIHWPYQKSGEEINTIQTRGGDEGGFRPAVGLVVAFLDKSATPLEFSRLNLSPVPKPLFLLTSNVEIAC